MLRFVSPPTLMSCDSKSRVVCNRISCPYTVDFLSKLAWYHDGCAFVRPSMLQPDGVLRFVSRGFPDCGVFWIAGTVSITITLFNKAVFSYYEFKFPLTLFVAQMIFSLMFVNGLKFINSERFGFPNFQWSVARKVSLNICDMLLSLQKFYESHDFLTMCL